MAAPVVSFTVRSRSVFNPLVRLLHRLSDIGRIGVAPVYKQKRLVGGVYLLGRIPTNVLTWPSMITRRVILILSFLRTLIN